METTQDINAESIVVRFAGDSGDGVQLMGTQFVSSTAQQGSDFATFPDYPAEIRAPVGTTFQVRVWPGSTLPNTNSRFSRCGFLEPVTP